MVSWNTFFHKSWLVFQKCSYLVLSLQLRLCLKFSCWLDVRFVSVTWLPCCRWSVWSCLKLDYGGVQTYPLLPSTCKPALSVTLSWDCLMAVAPINSIVSSSKVDRALVRVPSLLWWIIGCRSNLLWRVLKWKSVFDMMVFISIRCVRRHEQYFNTQRNKFTDCLLTSCVPSHMKLLMERVELSYCLGCCYLPSILYPPDGLPVLGVPSLCSDCPAFLCFDIVLTSKTGFFPCLASHGVTSLLGFSCLVVHTPTFIFGLQSLRTRCFIVVLFLASVLKEEAKKQCGKLGTKNSVRN